MSGPVHSMDESCTKQRLRHGANFNRHIEPPTHHFRVSGQTSQSICRFNLCGFLVRELEPLFIGVQISFAANIEEVASFHPNLLAGGNQRFAMIRSLLKSATSIPSDRFGLAIAYSLRDFLPRQVAIDCLVGRT
jgi:hypothetical protein